MARLKTLVAKYSGYYSAKAKLAPYLYKPYRIDPYGKTKYFFYNHENSGSSCINPLSKFIDSGIRRQAQNPLKPNTCLVKALDGEFKNSGIIQFNISSLAGGERLFTQMLNEISERQHLEKEKIKTWQSSEDYRFKQSSKDQKNSFRYDFKLEPHFNLPSWQLATHPEILALVNSYMSTYCRLYFAEYWLSIPLPSQITTPQPAQLWHRDGFGTVVKLFLYLNDVNLENGAFCYASGSHKGYDRSLHGKNYRLQDQEIEQLFGNRLKIVEAIAKSGDIVLANTSAYHKGSFVRHGSRLLFTASYFCPWVREFGGLKSLIPQPGVDSLSGLHPAQIYALGLEED